jgi:hypothetical protein
MFGASFNDSPGHKKRVRATTSTLHIGEEKPKREGALLFFEHKDERRVVFFFCRLRVWNAQSETSPGASLSDGKKRKPRGQRAFCAATSARKKAERVSAEVF